MNLSIILTTNCSNTDRSFHVRFTQNKTIINETISMQYLLTLISNCTLALKSIQLQQSDSIRFNLIIIKTHCKTIVIEKMLWISFCQKTETMMLVYYIVPLIKKNKNKLYQSVPDSLQMQLCYWYEKPIWYPSWDLHIWHGVFHLLIFNLLFFF